MSTAPARLTRTLRRARTSARRHPVRAGGIVLGFVVAAGLVWVAVTAVLAAHAAQQAQQQLAAIKSRLTSTQLTGLGPATAQLDRLTARADDLTSGPAWWLTAHVPVLGVPAAQVRAATRAAHDVAARALPELVQAADGVDPAKLRADGHTLRLGPVQAAVPHLHRAGRAIDDAVRGLAAAPGDGWLSAVDSRLADTRAQLDTLQHSVRSAELGARLLPSLAGADGPRRYFVGLQNEAELRGTGGIPGTFAILVADHGSLRFTHFLSDSAIDDGSGPGVAHTGLHFGAGYDQAYGASAPTREFVNSSISPDFPQAAQIWAAMWQRVSHEHVDGAIAVDPTVLSYLLAVIGPTPVSGAGAGNTVDAANVVPLTERDEYRRFPTNAARKAFLVRLTTAVDTKLLSGAGDPVALVQALGRAAGGNRLQVWSARSDEESLLRRTAISGALPSVNSPLAALAITNVAGTKLDYYLRRTQTVEPLSCGNNRQLRVTVTLTNTAPTRGLPAYVRTRTDSHGAHASPGSNRLWVDYVTGAGTTLLSATRDGQDVGLQSLSVAGHPTFRYDLDLAAGSSTTLVLRLVEPGAGPLKVWRQPGVTGLHSTVYRSCG